MLQNGESLGRTHGITPAYRRPQRPSRLRRGAGALRLHSLVSSTGKWVEFNQRRGNRGDPLEPERV